MKKFKQQIIGNQPTDFILICKQKHQKKMVGDCLLTFKHFVMITKGTTR